MSFWLALRQQKGDEKKALEQVNKKLIRANETLKSYEENEEMPANAQAVTLAQIKLLHDQLSDHTGLLSSKMEVHRLETMKYVDDKFNQQDATMAGMIQHQTDVLVDEGNAQHVRMESLICNFAESMDGAFQVGTGRSTPLGGEVEARRLEELKSLQYQSEEDKRTKAEQRQKGAKLLRIGEQQRQMNGRRVQWMGFNKWAQLTALALMNDTVYGKLNRSKEGLRRMALLPTFSNRVLRDERGDVRKSDIDDMPTTLIVLTG